MTQSQPTGLAGSFSERPRPNGMLSIALGAIPTSPPAIRPGDHNLNPNKAGDTHTQPRPRANPETEQDTGHCQHHDRADEEDARRA